MISSKKLPVIAILLTALALVSVYVAMVYQRNSPTDEIIGKVSYSDLHSVSFTGDDYYSSFSGSGTVKISLLGDYIKCSDPGVTVEDGSATISGPGVYVLSGSLSDGSIVVDSPDKGTVRLILNGADITSSKTSPIYVKQASKTIISLAPGSENTVTDNTVSSKAESDDTPLGAAIFSKDELVINGGGSLNAVGNCLDAIKANDGFKITGGAITVSATDDGINVNDYFAAVNCTIDVSSGGDGIKCEHTEESKGFIAIENSGLNVKSGGDGICASSGLYMTDSDSVITTGGGNRSASVGRLFGKSGQNTVSTKALKAGRNLTVNGGSLVADSAEDGLHSDGNASLSGGTYTISAANDAIHADLNLAINPEVLSIPSCYEGLEGAYITIEGGDISIVSGDDAINAIGEESGQGRFMPGRDYGGEEKTEPDDIWLTVNGGNIHIETSGDGFDSNGSAVISGGYLEIFGPENNGNGSVDVGDGGYVLIMKGGTLFAAGTGGMAEYPSDSSTQPCIAFNLDNTHTEKSSISIKDSSGNEIISASTDKIFNWILLSSDKLLEGEPYTLFIDGEPTSLTANAGTAAAGASFGFR